MAGGITSQAVSRRRVATGQSGWVRPFELFSSSMFVSKLTLVSKAGLANNRRVFMIAVFASLGGL